MAPELPNPDAVRADVWLWAARFYKTRRLSHEAISGGRITVNDTPCKPARLLKAGDILDISRGSERMQVQVLALSAQRGPASVAQTLYRESDASLATREAARELARLRGPAGPAMRPDKSARRVLRQLKHGQ